jgi:hypothetical protein
MSVEQSVAAATLVIKFYETRLTEDTYEIADWNTLKNMAIADTLLFGKAVHSLCMPGKKSFIIFAAVLAYAVYMRVKMLRRR